MEISNEKCSAADMIFQMTTKVGRDRRTTRLVELDWFACTPRTLPPVPPPLHPVPRSGIWDLGCPIHIKSFCQEKNTRNPQKNPTPGLWHRRRRCCAEPEYQLHTWLISSCQWLLHPSTSSRSENAAIFDTFLYDSIFIEDCSWFLFNVYIPGTVSVSIRPPQWFSIFPIMEEAAPLRYLCSQFWKPRPLIVQIFMSLCAVKSDTNLSKSTKNRGRSQYTYVLSGQ